MKTNTNPFKLPENTGDMTLPEPSLLTYLSNLNNRVIWLDSEVDEQWLELSRLILLWNKQDKGVPVGERTPIKLMFASNGGDLDINNSIIDTIELSKTPIWGVNMGYACSAACFIFMSCHVRYSLPRAFFLLHRGSGQFQGTYEQVTVEMEEYKRKIQELAGFILGHSTIDEETLCGNLGGEWYVTAEEAVKLGICDKIITDIDEVL